MAFLARAAISSLMILVAQLFLFEARFAKALSPDHPKTPFLALQFPTPHEIVRNNKDVVMAWTTSNFRMPEDGKVKALLNGVLMGEWAVPPDDNEGNVRMIVTAPELPIGIHVLRVSLVNTEGEEFGIVEETTFTIDPEAQPPRSGSVVTGGCGSPHLCVADGDCNQGRCESGACVCNPDWVGDLCDHSILGNLSYLPSVNPSLSPSRCIKSRVFEEGSIELQTTLYDLHEVPNCADSEKAMVFLAPHHGLGGNIHLAMQCVTRALSEGKGAVFRGPWRYGAHEGCRMPGLSCDFEPHDRCFEAVTTGSADDPLAEVEPYKEQRFGGWYAPNWREVTPQSLDYVPQPWRQQHGMLWWRAQLMNFLARPRATTIAKLRALQGGMGWQHPIAGVHVRHGDACFHGAVSEYRPPCENFESYASAMKTMSQVYGVKTFFLATDSQDIISQATSMDERFKILHVDFDRSVFDSKWFIEYRMNEHTVDRGMVSESATMDLLLLSSCDYLIGTFTSHFSKAALEMMVARMGFVPPYISLDIPYGMHGENTPSQLDPVRA